MVEKKEKGKYYDLICYLIKDLKYGYRHMLYHGIKDSLPNYGIEDINHDEFEHSFTWALADTFNGGVEVEHLYEKDNPKERPKHYWDGIKQK